MNPLISTFKSKVYLVLFVISCILTLSAVNYGGLTENIISRGIRHTFLLLLYISITPKQHPIISFFSIITFVVGSLLSFDSNNITAILLVIVYRILLVYYIFNKNSWKKSTWKNYYGLLILLVILTTIILPLYFTNTIFFYLSIIAELILLFLIFLSFTALLHTQKKGNLEFFYAIAIFFVCDALFGVKRLSEFDKIISTIASIFYNLGYLLIIYSDSKLQIKSNEK